MKTLLDKYAILQEIKRRLAEVHGERLKGVILYGSVARGEENEDSDIDVLVLLEGPIQLMRDIQKNNRAVFDLSLELGHPISAKPADYERFQTYECPLYINVKREGIAA
ncbi:MAG: nucleotidyltransferase domain-containing protein [Candidatus Hydrogenedentes bacterium]|nr:nucleotidyltransferase domain-containing protein [Candidatus Hydrogenedentota bacterium]MBI3117349.1 nucleotidyltransferase domain-containing protein [Candidatus Hydrogenedentota bacterium]